MRLDALSSSSCHIHMQLQLIRVARQGFDEVLESFRLSRVQNSDVDLIMANSHRKEFDLLIELSV